MAKSNSSKMLSGNQEYFTPKFLQIKQDDKFFSRLLSKEKNSSSSFVAGDSSFRVSYYGGAAGSVPFMWESQPGTPKHAFSDNPLPPLTPPPSYKFSPNNSMQKKNTRNSKMFSSIMPRIISSKKINISPSFSSSSSCSSSSYSAPSTPMNRPSNTKKYSKASSTSAIHFGLYEEGQESISPTSTLCFGNRNGSSSKIRRQYYPMKSVKRAFLSIVGHTN